MVKVQELIVYMKKLLDKEEVKTVCFRAEQTLNDNLSHITKKYKVDKTTLLKLGAVFIVFLFAEGYYNKMQELATLQKKNIIEVLQEVIKQGLKKMEG